MTAYFGRRPRPSVPPADVNTAKTIADSKTETSRLMEVLDSNNHGNVHGGVIMRMVDETAAIVAMKHCRRPVVTARIDRMDFVAPAYIGDLIKVNASLNYVGRTSMEVGVVVTGERILSGEVRTIVSSQLVFVAMDEDFKPTQVPPLVATTAEEATRIETAKRRRELQKQIEEELARLQNEPI